MALITINQLSIGFRGPPLLASVDCRIEPGQRIGLLGRNGAGKTTFMRILHGDLEPDRGRIEIASGARIALLPQDVPRDVAGTVRDIVRRGWRPPAGDAHADEGGKWHAQHEVEQILTRMELDGAGRFEVLSAGMKRRVLLAQAIVMDPDLLLLDEPTNHLDIDAIRWLEKFLERWRGTLIFVTHDRMFLRRMANRILENDRGKLFDWSCDYDTFLRRKQAALEAEEKRNARFDKKLAREENWIRQGIKARRTRNEGRVRALEQLRRQRRERRTQQAKVRLRVDHGVRSGNLVAEVEAISFAYGDRTIVRDFSTTILRGDKVGLIGPNGAGKTTLLRLILGQLPVQTGRVRLGTNLRIAYFDHLRDQLDDRLTVQEQVGDGSDTVQVGGQARHVIGYLRDFLFSPERARTPIRFLSGGERNRVLLAKLLAKPANVIVLDEPTNDLDLETLELLEEQLVRYSGTLLLVSHDRAFLNNVVTSTIVFEPGGVKEYVGGFDDWVRQCAEAAPTSRNSARGPVDNKNKTAAARKRRLSYKQQQELAALPQRIEQMEAEIAALHEAMAQPAYYQQPGSQIAADQKQLDQLQTELAAAYARWEELDNI